MRKENFKIDLHHVTTKDGYILSLYNIQPKLRSASNQSKPRIAFFVHGLLGSAGEFVSSGQNRSAAYFFANQGYDVWLSNLRGTFLAQNHTKFDANTVEYWQFSWHEMGMLQTIHILQKRKF